MTMEKSFTEFIILYEKKIISKDVDTVEDGINSISEKVSVITGPELTKELEDATTKLSEGIKAIKKILNKHDLYEI